MRGQHVQTELVDQARRAVRAAYRCEAPQARPRLNFSWAESPSLPAPPGQGQPWQHYDLGHGWCSYTFFEQCQHRMARARCDVYTTKRSSRAQLLEACANLQRMLAEIPLTEDEQAAVDDDRQALPRPLERLTDTATPAGPTPRQVGVLPTATLRPITSVQTRRPDGT
ncbi:MAG TPA: hypothetical protein VI248_02700 [Kineosporiaceae bacterium]